MSSFSPNACKRFVLLALAAGLVMVRADGEDAVRFNRDIRPILSETCFHCHGPDEHGRQADLRLDTLEGAMVDLGGGTQPIKPGDLNASEAWQRIISDDADLKMPPPDSHLVLTDEQVQLVRRWIEAGAPYEGHWAFAPPEPPTIPEVAGDWGRSTIDAFVAQGIADAELTPAPEAPARTLIRRLTYDLTGLPPRLANVREFERDYAARGEAAYQDAVTRLLASKHFGERMAVNWLDQARYADTNGYSIDGGRDMWLYRDWVIHAYNTNLPFDQFLIEQLAGDLLPNATDAQLIASGFNRNHMVTHEGGTIPEENLTNYVADRVRTTSEVFLGLTMGCAQCHDHKYDAISQKEYYQFFAFFNELDDRGLDGNGGINPAPKMLAKTVLPTDEVPALRRELAELTKRWKTSRLGWENWLAEQRSLEQRRGQGFAIHPVELLDVSSPNRPGEFTVQVDGSVLLPQPSAGLNSFSHSLRLTGDEPVSGLRVKFLPYDANERDATPAKLTPFAPGVPQVTAVLVSAGDQAAKQVEYYRQVGFSQATASSSEPGNAPEGVLDERNLHWWKPTGATTEQHLTLTFDEPIDPAVTPYLSVMLVFGVNDSLPHHWRIDAITGKDTDSVLPDAVAAAVVRPPATWTPEERSVVLASFRERCESLAPLRIQIANVTERIDVLTRPHPVMVMNTAAKPRETFVLSRGQYDAPLEKVEPATLGVLPPMKTTGRANRLDLAKWLTRDDHPLTARVAVNRLWAIFFGNGLVTTSADFGSQGQWPTHPELLDHLAIEFIESGWDQHAMIRQIVSSATYRQASTPSDHDRQVDPHNRWLARGPRFRLPAEAIRDTALSLSGLLVDRVGGPSVHPYQPPGLWKEISHFGSTPATMQVFVQDKGEKLYRRSLYTFIKRTSPNPAMSAFDAPNREMCVMQRGVTNTPLQALVTLNDPQFAEAARVMAARWLRSSSVMTDRERLTEAFEHVTSRTPQPVELDMMSELLRDERTRYQLTPNEAVRTVLVGEWPRADELDPVELAAWSQIAALLLNLSETLTRQ